MKGRALFYGKILSNTLLQRFFRICAFVACDFLMNQIVDTIIACYAQACFPQAFCSRKRHDLSIYYFKVQHTTGFTLYFVYHKRYENFFLRKIWCSFFYIRLPRHLFCLSQLSIQNQWLNCNTINLKYNMKYTNDCCTTLFKMFKKHWIYFALFASHSANLKSILTLSYMIHRNVCFFFRLLNFFVKLENYTGTIQSEKRRYSVSLFSMF